MRARLWLTLTCQPIPPARPPPPVRTLTLWEATTKLMSIEHNPWVETDTHQNGLCYIGCGCVGVGVGVGVTV
jgi:hypothetical protein